MNRSSDELSRRVSVTIREVAQHAGVSQMTVSRVLNQPELVRKETCERVEVAIKALNYRPNILARGLAGGKSLFIGLIYENPSFNYLGELLLGALNTCREEGHHLVVENFLGDALDGGQETLRDRLRDAGVDGLIVCPPLGEDPRVGAALREAGIPFVQISPGDAGPSDAFVMIDDVAAADRMTQYLIDRGHRDIGLILGAPTHKSSAARERGYRAAMARNGITVSGDLIAAGAFTYRSGMKATQALLAASQRPTAIFASNDDMAAGAIAAAHQAGLHVPADLSIVGFDDTPMASAVWPGLTTIRQPIAEMARAAVQLLAPPRGTPRKTGIVLDVTLVERDSVASR